MNNIGSWGPVLPFAIVAISMAHLPYGPNPLDGYKGEVVAWTQEQLGSGDRI